MDSSSSNTVTELNTIQCTWHQVGETFLAGKHGGAFATRYIVTRIEKGITYYREARDLRIS